MKLLTPNMYRLKPEQEAWLKSCAIKQGHGNRSLVLRLLIDRAMREAERRKAS